MRKVSVATTIMPGYDHVSGLERLRGPVTVIRRCESLAELISVARAGLADVVLVAGDTDQLTLTFMESLAADGRKGRTAAVVALSAVSEERDRLSRLGIPAASPDLEADQLATLLSDAASRDQTPASVPAAADPRGPARGRRAAQNAVQNGGRESAGNRATPQHPTTPAGRAPDEVTDVDDSRGAADVVPGIQAQAPVPGAVHAGSRGGPGAEAGASPDTEAALAAGAEAGTAEDAATAPAAPPRVTAVWGPAGSPGRTTVAVNLSVELALSGRKTLLIDLDTYAASAGVHLGLLDESAGIAQACRIADQGGITPAGVERSAVRARVAGTTLQVLTGLTRADRWPELRRAALDEVLEAAAAGWDEVVLDCGFCLEEDEELSFDVPAPQRNAATLAGLASADRILAIGTGDPVGLPRLIHGLDELGLHVDTVDRTTVEVVVNQVRAEASGVAPQSQITGVVDRFGGSWSVAAFLPWDRKALDRALLGGQVLAEAAPKSALRRAVARLTGTPAGSPAGSAPSGSGKSAIGKGLRTLLRRS